MAAPHKAPLVSDGFGILIVNHDPFVIISVNRLPWMRLSVAQDSDLACPLYGIERTEGDPRQCRHPQWNQAPRFFEIVVRLLILRHALRKSIHDFSGEVVNLLHVTGE